MTGASMEQAIWVIHNGATTTATLQQLYQAYVAGRLGEYRIYYVDPQSIEETLKDLEHPKKPLVSSMGVLDMRNQGIHQKITVTSEDDLSVTLGATGMLLDYADFDPPHVTCNLPGNTKHYVTALSSLGGPPGDKIFVRSIKKYWMTGSCNVLTLPTPNMIAASGFVIMS